MLRQWHERAHVTVDVVGKAAAKLVVLCVRSKFVRIGLIESKAITPAERR